MPVQRCQLDGKPGYKWGKQGKCYTYTAGDAASRGRAKQKATKQGLAIGEANKEAIMVQKVGRGEPVQESAGSITQYTRRVSRDFRRQFGASMSESDWYGYVVDVYQDHVIVYDYDLPDGQYWLATYELGDDEHYVFQGRDDWSTVELTYQLAGELTESKKLAEVLTAAVVLEEATGAGKPRYISGIGVTADVINANGRRYPYPVLKRAVDQAISHLNESTGQGRIAYVLGEADHPSDKGHTRSQFLETITNWTSLRLDSSTKQVQIRGRMIESSKGQDAIAVMEGGVLPGISMRGYGVSRIVEEANGSTVVEVVDLTLTGFDLLVPGEQSDPNGEISLLESAKTRKQHQEEGSDMDPEQVLAALMESGAMDTLAGTLLVRIQEAQDQANEGQRMQLLREALGVETDAEIVGAVTKLIAESTGTPNVGDSVLRTALGLEEGVDVDGVLEGRMTRLQELEDAETQRGVDTFVEGTIKALKYPSWMKDQLTEAVQGAAPKTKDAAKALIESRRKEYSGMLSRLDLAAKGNVHGLEVLGPVIERDLGIPAFAAVSHEISESLHNRNVLTLKRADLVSPKTINERFAAQYLAKFDAAHKHNLVQEAALFAEAEQVSDLSLPYSVTRAIIAEAVPMLIATSIYDVAMTDQSDTRVYYETYAGETGETVAIAAEDFTSDEDAWVQLDYKRIVPGTLSVEPDGGGTPWVEGTDYVMDYANGKIWTLAAGGIGDSTATEIDYSYKAYRLGEMAAIERGKGTLAFTTLAMVADRLATEISTEAALFSRSQLGWDATARTLSMLVFQIAKKIDQDLLYMALAGALIQASNSGGTWASATDTIDTLVQYIGVAKVLVGNRYYKPDHISCSLTNSDRLANWDGFTAAGKRPDSDLAANGYVGRLKGLPVFESTEHSDAYIVIANREIVHHRVFQPMILKGPYPSYSSNKLLASEQYYAEEINGSAAPVPEKAATVKIT